MQVVDFTFGNPRRGATRVRAGVRAIDLLVDDLRADPPGRLLLVISDDIVAPLHAAPLVRRLRRAGLRAALITFRHGEANKSRRTKQRLEDEMLAAGAGRDSAVIAVGGGVTGDLAGFVASTWHRGVPVLQVPTSLLAMVDSALGGKTAVNLPGGKNLVGTFHRPAAVYADVGLLSTLPDDEFVSGFAEVVKSAVVGDAKLFRWLEAEAGSLLERDGRALVHVVASCLAIKGRIVARDERESGRRVVLNFGHTVAHALEAATRYRMGHGRAVAVGIEIESRLARRTTGFPAAHAARVEALLEAFGLPTAPPRRLPVEALVRATGLDKKNRAGEVRYALPRAIGRMLPAPGFTVPVKAAVLRSALAGPLD